MSTHVTFYAVQSAGVLSWAAKLAESACGKKQRVLVFCGSSEQADSIDEHLWTYQEDTFIPHEVYDPQNANRQTTLPVLISSEQTNGNSATILIQLGRAELDFGLSFSHVIELVDRADQQELELSRERYKAWKALAQTHDVKVEFKG